MLPLGTTARETVDPGLYPRPIRAAVVQPRSVRRTVRLTSSIKYQTPDTYQSVGYRKAYRIPKCLPQVPGAAKNNT